MTFPCLASKVFGTDTGKFRRQKGFSCFKYKRKELKNSFQKDSTCILFSEIEYQGLKSARHLSISLLSSGTLSTKAWYILIGVIYTKQYVLLRKLFMNQISQGSRKDLKPEKGVVLLLWIITLIKHFLLKWKV